MSRSVFAALCLSCFVAIPIHAEDESVQPGWFDAWQQHQALERASLFKGLTWRSIGPVLQGGRLVDIEVAPDEPYTFYVAYASGGLWRTENNGVTFKPIFDDQPTMIMGDVALDPNHPSTIWVGTGENNSSRSSYGGAGCFKSTDRGETWEYAGLGESDRIGRIVVHPDDSQTVYVACLGKLYSKGGQRGVYRTSDGGAHWACVLAGDDTTGFVDLLMHPSNPDILFAASWERLRTPWNMQEGGPGSGIWKSMDGGNTWTRLEGGLPKGQQVGRIGLTQCQSQPDVLYASIDNQAMLPESQWDLGDGAVTAKRLRSMTKEQFLDQDPLEIERFLRAHELDLEFTSEGLLEAVRTDRVTLQQILDALHNANLSLFETDIHGIEVWKSTDAGLTWKKTHDTPLTQVVHTYGYYFGQIRVSPKNPYQVYVLGVPMITSLDGGKTWHSLDAPNMHGDHQALWIDPEHPQRILAGNDGGLNLTFDGGASWLRLNAQEVGQFYTVTVDDQDPYHVYGGLQDNGVLKGSSHWDPRHDIPWQRIGFGDGMVVAVDPGDGATYWGFQFGNYFRNNPDGSRDKITPRASIFDSPLRYNWCTPIQLSPFHSHIIYFGANRVFRSFDRGVTWQPISPDLTHSQNRGDVPFATITTLSASDQEFGTIWVGTDDGCVWVTSDDGATWDECTQYLASDRWVTRVQASHHDPHVAYVSQSGYRQDDDTPYLFCTRDLGKSWSSIANNLPHEPVNVIREDPVNPKVLYVGTDRGVYVSLDAGQTWMALQSGLPNVPTHDLVVHPTQRELVAGTHGRSVWIVDVLPIQELTPEVRDAPIHIFPKEAVQAEWAWRSRRDPWFFRSPDAPEFSFPFWCKSPGKVRLSILAFDDQPVMETELDGVAGVNTFVWDLLLDADLALPAETRAKANEDITHQPWHDAVSLDRPLYITPGNYVITAEIDGHKASRTFHVKPPEPRKSRKPVAPKLRARPETEGAKAEK